MSSGLKLKLLVALTASLLSTAVMADDKTLVVWDFKSSEPLMKPYFDIIKTTFEKDHPGVTVQEIAQPADTYYTVLGTANNAKQGPDVVLLNGGNLAIDRAEALKPLQRKFADQPPVLVELTSIKTAEGDYIAILLSVQGAIWYYNMEVYQSAGLDQSKPSETWKD